MHKNWRSYCDCDKNTTWGPGWVIDSSFLGFGWDSWDSRCGIDHIGVRMEMGFEAVLSLKRAIACWWHRRCRIEQINGSRTCLGFLSAVDDAERCVEYITSHGRKAKQDDDRKKAGERLQK